MALHKISCLFLFTALYLALSVGQDVYPTSEQYRLTKKLTLDLKLSDDDEQLETERQIEKLTCTLINLKTFVDDLYLNLEVLYSRIESSKNWFFKISDVYKGRRYYLSQQDPITKSEESMATCEFYGGYLAEIEDLDEISFIKTFLKQFTGFKNVLIGGTIDGKEKVWKYKHSNTTVPSFLIKHHLYGYVDNCLYLADGLDWLMGDGNCYYTHPGYPTRFLCEIPETITKHVP